MFAITAAFAALALAASSYAVPLNSTALASRAYTNAQFTWYNPSVGQGACGGWNSDSDFVVALNQAQYNSGQCWKQITISYNGKSHGAQIVDECPGCPYGGLDLSPALFDFFTWQGAHGSPTDPGVLHGTWDYGSGSSSPPPPPPSGGSNRIHPNGNNGKCLDVAGGVMANGTPVQIYDCNGTGAQNWVIHSGSTAVQVAGTNYCLDASNPTSDGTKMKIWQCYPGIPAQSWFYTGDKRISLENQGKCLDLTNGSSGDGNVMQVWGCTTGNTNQVWTLS